MPLSSGPLSGRRTAFLLPTLLAAAAVAALGAVSLVEGSARQERLADLSAQAEALLARVTDAETGQRGFLLTGRDSYLEPYEAATSAIPAELDALARLAAGEAGLRAPVALLQRSVPAKLEELARTVALRRDEGPGPALAVVETDAGKALMDAVRAQVAALRASSDVLRIGVGHQTLWLVLGAGAAAAAAAGSAIALLARALHRGRHAEATLAEAEARFRGTFEQAAVGFAHVGLDGRWLLVNDRLCGITGYAKGELLALTFQDITHPDDLDADLAQVRALVAGRIATYAMEKRYLCKDGSEVWVNLTVSLLRDAAGRPERFISAIEDISARKAVEAALAAREAERRNLLATLDLGATMARDLDGTIRFWSAGCERLCGWTAEEAVGRASHELLQTRFPVPRAEIQAALERDGEWRGDLRHRTKHGREIVAAVHKALRRGPDGRPAAVMESLTDVTEHRLAEAALAEGEARLRLFVDRAPAAIAMFDAGMRYLAVSRRFLADYGFPPGTDPAALVGRGHYDLFPDMPGRWREVHRRALAGETLSAADDPFPREDGRTDWVRWEMAPWHRADGSVGGALLFSEVVTARVEAERALAASEARLRAVLDNLFAFVGILAPDGALLDANRAPLEAAGLSLAGIRGKPFWDCPWWTHDAAAQDRVREACRRAASGEASRFDAEIRVAGDGRMAIDFQVAPLRDARGRITHLIPSAVDVTERKRAEERQALLMREVDHRAKNALAVALSLVRLAPRDDARAFAVGVEGRIAAMARAHSLLAKERWGGADLRSLIEGELAAHAGRVRFAGPPVRLAAEAAQPVAMLLHELATNAAKHGALSAPGGTVDLEWDLGGEGGGLRLSWREAGGPPVAGAPGRKGFGSRLVAQLAERQLGGRLALDWAPSGLRVALALPPRHASPGLASTLETGKPPRRAGGPAAPAKLAPHEGAPRVLVVEDEALLAMELEGTLRALGFEVVGPARSLAEGLRFAAGTAPLDAAVLDVNLGGGERSFPVVDVLATRGVPYLFATGYASAGSLEGRDDGAAAVLRKPYQREALARSLEWALHRGAGAGGGAPRTGGGPVAAVDGEG